jgi:hypothetical protein
MTQLVPSLDDLARDPLCAMGLPMPTLAALQAQIAAAQGALAAAMSSAPSQSSQGQQAEVRLLTVDEAAAKLGVRPEWLYRRGKGLGLAAKLGDGTLRFSNVALEAYIKGQTIPVAPLARRRKAASST